MGNNIEKSIGVKEYFKSERLIDAESKIYIGIVSPLSNPLSGQAIRIGHNGKLKRLEKFIETSNSLIYEFELDTVLTLSKRDKEIIINLKEPNKKHLIKLMNSITRELFKPIKWNMTSFDFDKIPEFINSNLSDNKSSVGKRGF